MEPLLHASRERLYVAPSESFRDVLLRMEKLGFISETGIGLTLRNAEAAGLYFDV